MAAEDLNVGAWKLEHDKPKIQPELDKVAHARILGTLGLLPLYGEDQFNMVDLIANNQTGGYTMFTVKYDVDYHPVRERTGVRELEMRFAQPFVVDERSMIITSIFWANSFVPGDVPELQGGRKVRYFPHTFSADKSDWIFPRNAPEYVDYDHLSEDAEILAPVTGVGISEKLELLADQLETQRQQTAMKLFDELAVGLPS